MTIEYKDSKRISLLEADRTLRQGFDGGTASQNSAGSGGGGSGSAGGNVATGTNNGGSGGNGTANDILTGSSYTYAGGGGGGLWSNGGGSTGTGGSGGGGAGGASGGAVGANATGYGSGGGGGSEPQYYAGGNGSSGIVILRFTKVTPDQFTQVGGAETTVGSDTVITYTATSGTRTFTPSASFDVRYLIVAGGGGGGAGFNGYVGGGGGGAGGYLAGTSLGVTAQAYTIVVGAKGAGQAGSSTAGGSGTNGGNSSFSGYSHTAIGGGGGSQGSNGATALANNGGSGGGENSYVGVNGKGTSTDLTPTNVQDNSILVEKDTGNRYWFDLGVEPKGTSGSGGNWAEVSFNNSTIVNNESASGNVVTRTSGSGWNSYIRSNEYISPSTGGGEIYFTQSANTNISVGLEKSPFNPAPSATYTGKDYSFHTTSSSNNMYEHTSDYAGTAWASATNEYRITMDSAGLVKYYWRSGSSGAWTLERTSTVTASGDYYFTVSHSGTAGAITSYIKGTPATWTMEPTLESDFSSSTGWSQQGTEIAINTGTGKLDWIGLRSSTNTGISYDFGAGRISTSKWRLQFDLYIQNFSGTSYTQRLGWMLSTKGSADNSDQLRDFIGGRVTYRGQDPTNYQQFNTIDDQGSTDTWADNVPYQPAQGTDNGVTPVAGTTYNIVLTRDSPTAYTMTISSGGTLLDTLNYTSYAGTSDLRYLLIQRYGDAANAGSSFNGTIDNLKFYNGVTTIN